MDPRDETYLRQLGDRLRLARTRRGMTQRALADRSGVSFRFIVQTESGAGNLSVLRLRELADALGIPPPICWPTARTAVPAPYWRTSPPTTARSRNAPRPPARRCPRRPVPRA